MKKFTTALLICTGFFLALHSTSSAQSEQQQRIKASYVLAFGKDATSGKVSYWEKQGKFTISQLIAKHQEYLGKDAGTHKAAISRAYIDAMGRNPSQSEIDHWMKGTDTYTTLMKNHISWLQGNPTEYEKVISRSYFTVFGRSATADEKKYWKGQGVYSYMALVGYHEDYKRRNVTVAPGQKITLQPSSRIIVVPVTPSIAAEARSAASLATSGMVAAGGGNMVAAGGGNMVAAGGGNMVAAGGGN